MNVLRDSAPGLDGLPFSAWANAGDYAIDTLLNIDSWLRRGLRMPAAFNSILQVFLPKGSHADDDEVVAREPDTCRPLGLEGTDCKILCCAWNHAFRRHSSKHMHYTQRGFVPGRQLIQNVVDLDIHCRIAAAPSVDSRLPCLFAWDFAAAFPSVSWEWLEILLSHMRVPIGILEFIRGIYFCVQAFAACTGSHVFFDMIHAGVLQGCPLSGLLSTWVLEPMLLALEAKCRRDTVVRACADDIGAATTRFDEVVVLESLFSRWSRCSNLRLKPIKCNIVPLWKRGRFRLLK